MGEYSSILTIDNLKPSIDKIIALTTKPTQNEDSITGSFERPSFTIQTNQPDAIDRLKKESKIILSNI